MIYSDPRVPRGIHSHTRSGFSSEEYVVEEAGLLPAHPWPHPLGDYLCSNLKNNCSSKILPGLQIEREREREIERERERESERERERDCSTRASSRVLKVISIPHAFESLTSLKDRQEHGQHAFPLCSPYLFLNTRCLNNK